MNGEVREVLGRKWEEEKRWKLGMGNETGRIWDGK